VKEEVYSDYEKALEIKTKIETTQKQLDDLLASWTMLIEELE